MSVPPVPRTIGLEEEATTRERILFICTANVDRSRTAEDLYADDERYEIRSRGVAQFATQRLTQPDLLWADELFVMNQKKDGHLSDIKEKFPGVKSPVIELEMEDRWRCGVSELEEVLLKKLKRYLGAPRSGAEAGIMGESSEEG